MAVLIQRAPSPKKVSQTPQEAKSKNIQTEFIKDSSVAIIKFKSFDYAEYKEDYKTMLDLCKQLESYQNLIIDIQGNSGGFTGYWHDALVPFLTDTTITYKLNVAYKDTPGFYKFAGEDDEDSETQENFNFSNLPPEVNDGTYKFTTAEDAVKIHKKSVRFKGNIYLLADNKVFSSAEAFVYFCKTTGFAKVAGMQTGGHGIGSDPFLFTLPISGIVVSYPAIMGLNHDGSSNDEYGTFPDIELAGKTKNGKT